MKRLASASLVMAFVLAFLLFALACGGGGGSGGREALSGTWVTDCFPMNGAYEWGKYNFNAQSGEVVVMVEEFQTSDCSGTGVIRETETWTYSTGSEIECNSGSNGKCTELDMTFEDGITSYFLYSIFAGEDPDEMYLTTGYSDPADRPDNIDDLDLHLRNVPCPGKTGSAIIGLAVTDTGLSSTPFAPPGFMALDIDLNGGTLLPGYYVWLSYRLGRADGLEGTPVGMIYTVHESDGEKPLSASDIRVDVNLNGGSAVANSLWLYYRPSTGSQVVRCVVVANESDSETVYGPSIARMAYSDSITWVEELNPDSSKTPSEYPQPPDAQDLNEGQGGDWIFLGYAVD
jgi:hypothetical protein